MDTRQAIIDKVNEVVALARLKFPNYVTPTPRVEFYTKGRSAGVATAGNVVKFNLTVFEQDLNRFLATTVPHEIAHIVCFMLNLDRGHGRNWKNVCLRLGGDGLRCYSGDGLQLVCRTMKKYEHKASCGTVIMVTARMHNQLMRGITRKLIRTSGVINRDSFTGVCK
jgi:SprT protein